MRYVARKATLSPRRDDAALETGVDAARAWFSIVGEVPETSEKFHEVHSAVVKLGMSGFQVRAYMMSAAVLPCWKERQDPCDRLLAVIEHPEIYRAANNLVKAGHAKLSHQAALGYVPILSKILEITTTVDDVSLHLPSLVVLMLAEEGEVHHAAEQLPFTPTPEELAARVGVNKRSEDSLYPRVSTLATRESINQRRRNNNRNSGAARGAITKPKKIDFAATEDGSLMQRLRERCVDMDEEATDLIMQGMDIAKVLQFHEQAPQGYWEEVSKRMGEEGTDFDTVYNTLEPIFNYHPDSRELPQ